MEAIETYFNSLKLGNKSENTIRVYRKDLNKFQLFFSLNTVEDIERLTVQDYMRFYSQASESLKKSKSINGLIRSISAFIGWLESSDMISKDNSFHKVKFGGRGKFVSETFVEKDVLNDEQIKSIIKAGWNTEVRLMLAMLAYQGFRRDEVRRIRKSDVKECSVLIRGKGNKIFKVDLHPDICTMMNVYFAENENIDYLFRSERGEKSEDGMLSATSVNNRVKRAMELAGFPEEEITKWSAHSFRHSFGTNMIKEFGFEVGSQALRHVSKKNTEIYDHSKSFLSNQAIVKQRSLDIL